jgi:arginase
MSQPGRRQVHLIGLPTDSNSSFLRGPAKGPAQIRRALYSDQGNPAAENGLEIGTEISILDLGDAALREDAGDDRVIEDLVTRTAGAGHFPMLLGGDHSITAPIARALAQVHGPLNILHIDAHPDLYENMQGNPRSHASPFARIMEAGAARRLVQVGIRTLNHHQREQARRYGVEIVAAAEFSAQSVPVLAAPLYVSIDLDGLDPSAAPGVSHHEPGGLTVREVLAVLARQTARLVGADVVELNPDRDLNGVTAVVAAKLVKEIIASPGAA